MTIKHLYHVGAMDTKRDLIKSTIEQLLRVTKKYSRIERMPVDVNEEVQITTREVHTVQAIGERKALNVTDVATHFGVTKSASSQILKRLEEKGFIEKSPSPHSGKELELSLTDLGREAFEAHERFHGRDMEALIDRLDAYPIQQIATLSVLLDAIGAIMDERLGEE